MGCGDSKVQRIKQEAAPVPKEYSIGSKTLTPTVGFTIKFAIKTDRLIGKYNYKGKFFINLLHHDEIPTLVIGNKIRQSTDKTGSICNCLDVTINTQLFLQCSTDIDHRNYIISQIITIVNDMVIVNKATLDLPYEYVLPNMKRGYVGDKINAIKKSDYHRYPVFPLVPYDKNLHTISKPTTSPTTSPTKKNEAVIKEVIKENIVKQPSTVVTKTVASPLEISKVRETVTEPKKEINYDEFLQQYFSQNEKLKEGTLIVGALISRPSGPAAINVVHKRVMVLSTHKADYGRILFFHPQNKDLKGEFLITTKLKVHEKKPNSYEFEYDTNLPPSLLPFIDDEKNDLKYWTDIVDKMNKEMAKSVIPKELDRRTLNKRIDDESVRDKDVVATRIGDEG